ncbi:hypothetical protein CRYUN_Cryun33cG0093300 [Craigia yunnanensis]
MLLAPSLSRSPEDSPSTTSVPPLQPLPVVQPPLVVPVGSLPSPTTNTASPVVSPPLLTPPLAPISTPVTPAPFLTVAYPPPAAIATSPVTPPQPPTPPVFTYPPPPAATTIGPVASPSHPPPPALVIPSPPAAITISPVTPPQPPTPPVFTYPPPPPSPAAINISPVASPPHLPPPALVIPSPQLPRTHVPPPQPSTPLPSTSPLPSRTPPIPPLVILPPPAITAPSLPPPRPPIDPPSFSLVSPPPSAASHFFPNTPGSSQGFPLPAPPPSLPLAVGKGGLPATKQGSHSPIGLIVACTGVGILLFVVFALVCICCKSRRRKQKPSTNNKKQQCWVTKDGFFTAPNQPEPEKVARPGAHVIEVLPKALPPPQLNNAKGSGSKNSGTVTAHTTLNSSSGIFTYDELAVATNGFSESNLLGQGGFGYVHKGVLPSGQEVAVKQLKAGSQQGEREFQAEVETISRVHHKHLVSLVGYCITGAERLLVYEFVPNKTLEFHLHGNGQPVIVWESRLKIAIGSAKGIAYLHEDCSPTIIHRDIKAANILLDPQFEAKVSDFGLAKIFFDASSSITHIFTRVVGTFGLDRFLSHPSSFPI